MIPAPAIVKIAVGAVPTSEGAHIIVPTTAEVSGDGYNNKGDCADELLVDVLKCGEPAGAEAGSDGAKLVVNETGEPSLGDATSVWTIGGSFRFLSSNVAKLKAMVVALFDNNARCYRDVSDRLLRCEMVLCQIAAKHNIAVTMVLGGGSAQDDAAVMTGGCDPVMTAAAGDLERGLKHIDRALGFSSRRWAGAVDSTSIGASKDASNDANVDPVVAPEADGEHGSVVPETDGEHASQRVSMLSSPSSSASSVEDDENKHC